MKFFTRAEFANDGCECRRNEGQTQHTAHIERLPETKLNQRQTVTNLYISEANMKYEGQSM